MVLPSIPVRPQTSGGVSFLQGTLLFDKSEIGIEACVFL